MSYNEMLKRALTAHKYWQGAESHNPLVAVQKVLINRAQPARAQRCDSAATDPEARGRPAALHRSEAQTHGASSSQSTRSIGMLRGC